MKKNILALCLLVALFEGFAGLGIEIYAIRVSAIYIGASISITGIILAMVLIAIAAGYWLGGRLSAATTSANAALLKAGRVLALSALCHSIACFIQIPFLNFMVFNSVNALLSAIGVGLLFGAGLVFGSTSIPLLTQYLTLSSKFKDGVDAGQNAGLMVAITTVGSVLGSTLTPILLLPYIGLTLSLQLFIIALIASSIIALQCSKKISSQDNLPQTHSATSHIICVVAGVLALCFTAVSNLTEGHQTATGGWYIQKGIYEDKLVTTISDSPFQSVSSCWVKAEQQNCNDYGKLVIDAAEEYTPQNLIFLGGAGMSIPSQIAIENPDMHLTVIDIDKDLPKIIEKHFLEAPLAPNIEFIGTDARGYLSGPQSRHYDLLFIDAFQGTYVASNLFTVEALSKFKNSSDLVMANIIARTDEYSGYSQTLFNSWYKVFGKNSYIVTTNKSYNIQNIMLCNFPCGNGAELDKTDYFNLAFKPHTDNLPRLDRYYYQEI